MHITSLGQDYYRYDSDHRRLVGETSGKVYKTGDRLEVQVSRVDMEQGRIDFSLIDVKNEKFGRGKGGSSKKSSGKSKRSYSHSSKSKKNKGKSSNTKSGSSRNKKRK